MQGSTAPGGSGRRASTVLPSYFSAYEREHAIQVVRPVAVHRVDDEDGLLVTRAGHRSWTSRALVNATGTWSHPFVPHYPGIATFGGEQMHTAD